MIKKYNAMLITKFATFIISCIFIISSCSDDNETNKNQFDKLNGFWIGHQKIQQIGDCSINGDSISIIDALLQIEINEAGIVDIIEYFYIDSLDTYYYIDSINYNWTGSINEEYDFVFQKPGFSYCFGEPRREFSTQYEGTILSNNGDFTLNTNSEEEWCPSENCIFNIEYDLSHIDSLITNIKKYDESDFNFRLKSAVLHRFKN